MSESVIDDESPAIFAVPRFLNPRVITTQYRPHKRRNTRSRDVRASRVPRAGQARRNARHPCPFLFFPLARWRGGVVVWVEWARRPHKARSHVVHHSPSTARFVRTSFGGYLDFSSGGARWRFPLFPPPVPRLAKISPPGQAVAAGHLAQRAL